eukprot:12453040-Alexandrium_andersonii.AAC.1
MAGQLVDALHAGGLRLQPSKCTLVLNEYGSKRSIVVKGELIKAQMDPEVQILGVKIRTDASEDSELDFKISRGWKAFWRLRKLLTNKGAPY